MRTGGALHSIHQKRGRLASRHTDACLVQRHEMPKDGASHDGVQGIDAASSSNGGDGGHHG